MMQEPSAYIPKLKAASDRALPRLPADFTEIASHFDPDLEPGAKFVPDGLVPIAGLPLWQALSDERKLLFNRLTWCHYYHKIALLELTVNDLSNLTAFRRMRKGDLETAHYVARETAEETVHIEAFSSIIRKTLERSGIDPKDFYAAHEPAARRYERYVAIMRASFRALGHSSLYYLTRYTLNIAGRLYEHEISRSEEVHSDIRRIVKNHMHDESRHLTMSRFTGQQCFKDARRLRALGVASVWSAFVALVPPETHFDGPEHAWFDFALSCIGVSEAERKKAIRDLPQSIAASPQLTSVRDFFLKENLAVLDAAPIPASVKKIYGKALSARLSFRHRIAPA